MQASRMGEEHSRKHCAYGRRAGRRDRYWPFGASKGVAAVRRSLKPPTCTSENAHAVSAALKTLAKEMAIDSCVGRASWYGCA